MRVWRAEQAGQLALKQNGSSVAVLSIGVQGKIFFFCIKGFAAEKRKPLTRPSAVNWSLCSFKFREDSLPCPSTTGHLLMLAFLGAFSKQEQQELRSGYQSALLKSLHTEGRDRIGGFLKP